MKRIGISYSSAVDYLVFLAISTLMWLTITGYLVPGFKEIYSLKSDTTGVHNIGLIWVPVIGYLSVCITVYYVVTFLVGIERVKALVLIEVLYSEMAKVSFGIFCLSSTVAFLVGLIGFFTSNFSIVFILSFVVVFESLSIIYASVWGIKVYSSWRCWVRS